MIVLLVSLPAVIITRGADAVAQTGPWVLLGCALLSVALAFAGKTATRRGLRLGLLRSAGQILPAVPILVCIAMVSTTWMVSGVVPTLICYGLDILSQSLFLMLACMVSAVISVLTGSSWTTLATIGVAFMGIGEVLGYSAPWIAGAIISGAYFGDKVSPLSDTTVVASSAAGVDLFKHIRYLMVTTIPSIVIALVIYLLVGLLGDHTSAATNPGEMTAAIHSTFNVTPWVLVIPAVTVLLIVMRVNTLLVLFIGAILGGVGVFIFQPQLGMEVTHVLKAFWQGTRFDTGVTSLDELTATGGITGMWSTIFLVLGAMTFGSAMIGTGMLSRITESFTTSLRKRTSIVGATVTSGLTMNCLTADQYLSLIITGNMYRGLYRRFGLESRLLSRAMEDSVSVTSVLIPWNSCGVTQSTVLGVSTLAYFPFCIFNILSPIMSVMVAWIGYRIPATRAEAAAARPLAANPA
ncbi:MAG: sodium:proton antiporter [Muribaculaceae bacterium]|nr:sodium:proton antiporter [Muribaculaceae bacterium]